MNRTAKRPRIFVTQPIAASALERIKAVADVTVNLEDSRILPREELLAGVAECDFLAPLMHDKIDRSIITANPDLRAITSMAITPSDIDIEEATRRGIVVTTAPALVTESTADICFGLILAVARRIVEGDKLVRRGVFPGGQSNHLIGGGVFGKTLGLIGGGGRIGSAVARRARGFQMNILYWSPRRKPSDLERDLGAEFVPLDELLRRSDFVSLHSPLREETRGQISARELSLMKPTAFLINTSRGPIVDEAALVEALERGQIAGAGLDVFEREPAVTPALLKMSNVVLTPHLGSAVVETREALANAVADNVLALIEGRRPPNIYNPEVFDAWIARRARDEGEALPAAVKAESSSAR
jgi:glyoxylate reductase